MSEENVINENLEVEELSNEDKKKAINLQDLKYIKKYIDDRHYSKDDVDNKLGPIVKEEIDTTINNLREEITEDINTAIEASNKSYTKEETDAKYYQKTDTVANATEATQANWLFDAFNDKRMAICISDDDHYASITKRDDVIYFIEE